MLVEKFFHWRQGSAWPVWFGSFFSNKICMKNCCKTIAVHLADALIFDSQISRELFFGIERDIFGENSLLVSILTPLEMADFKQDGLLS